MNTLKIGLMMLVAVLFSGLFYGGCVSSNNDEPTSLSNDDSTLLLKPSNESRVIVGFHGEPDATVFSSNGGQAEIWLSSSNAIAGRVPAHTILHIKSLNNIKYVEDDVVVDVLGKATGKPSGGTTQPPQSTPWGVDRIDANLAWSSSTGVGVKVAVIDTGIDNGHPDFKNANGNSRVILGATFVTGTKSAKDDNGHGTHVAGTIGASNNSIGVVGVAPNCTLLAVKVLDRTGSGYMSWVIAGIDWAANNGAQVINLSLGSSTGSQALKDAVDRAVANGVVVVAAAGNNGDKGNAASYPAAYDSVIAVGATDSYDLVAPFSNYGLYLDVAAPGVSVLSTWKGGGYVTASGTSMASPHVAGTCALVIAKGVTDVNADGVANNLDVRLLIQSKADDINYLAYPGWDQYIGNGLVDSQESTTGQQTLP